MDEDQLIGEQPSQDELDHNTKFYANAMYEDWRDTARLEETRSLEAALREAINARSVTNVEALLAALAVAATTLYYIPQREPTTDMERGSDFMLYATGHVALARMVGEVRTAALAGRSMTREEVYAFRLAELDKLRAANQARREQMN